MIFPHCPLYLALTIHFYSGVGSRLSFFFGFLSENSGFLLIFLASSILVLNTLPAASVAFKTFIVFRTALSDETIALKPSLIAPQFPPGDIAFGTSPPAALINS